MTEALFIFAYVVFSFAIGIRVGRHINEGQRPPGLCDSMAGDFAEKGDAFPAAQFPRFHNPGDMR